MFYSKDETTNFNADIVNGNNFKSFIYKAKLLEDTEVDGDNGIFKNVIIAALLKHLSNFWRSFEVLLTNRKIELKLKLTNYYVLSAGGVDNVNNNNSNYIIFTIKDAVICFSSNFIRKRQCLSNLFSKVRIKVQQMNIDIFTNQILLELIDYLFSFIQIKMLMLKYLMLKSIIY